MPAASYKVTGILPASDTVILNDVFLILLYANRIPPHLALSVNGKLFTLTVKGANVDGPLEPLLKLIKQKRIETLFIRLEVPALFTPEDLRKEIRTFTLAYPRVGEGIATCLNPIKDFCGEIYDPASRNVNFIFDLLPILQENGAANECYEMNLGPLLSGNEFSIMKYTMQDIYEGIKKANLQLV
jgi:hypothetical protein